MQPTKMWMEQCEAARRIEDDFGTQRALDYLVGEKFLKHLQDAENWPALREETASFAAEIRSLFEPWQLARYLETARSTRPFDASLYEDEEPEIVEDERKADIRRCANDLLLVEQARDWLLGEEAI